MANPYGRLLQVMAESVPEEGEYGLVIGEMMSGAKLKVNGLVLERKDYMVLTNSIKVNNKELKFPFRKAQSKTVNTGDGTTVTVSVPPLKKGDKVLCYQVDDEDVIILGRLE